MKAQYEALLKQWCDALLDLQIHGTNDPARDGGILCPACSVIHGRGHDAVYPMLYLYEATGDARYLDGAKSLFDWGEVELCDDGSYYNDSQSEWRSTTVFYAISLCEALDRHGSALDEATRARWDARLLQMGEWLHRTLTFEYSAVINYYATCAGAMALLGNRFDRADFKARAREMAHACMGYLTENGFLRGEGKPIDAVTPRGCFPIDIGYNVEESMPSLIQYAVALEDRPVYELLRDRFVKLLDLMLPDGGWDNSFGSRNFKWTYWGSRTTDGCQGVFTLLARENPVFREASLRNLECYAACTRDGLLHGGPHYHRHGERACTHHSFCHAKALAMALDEGIADGPRLPLPSDAPKPLVYYPEMDTWRVGVGDWRATLTAYDFLLANGTHATGGTLTLRWHRAWGPVIASSVTDYALIEAHNMQLSRRRAQHRSLTPRLTYGAYANCYDRRASVQTQVREGGVHVRAQACLADVDGNLPPRATQVQLNYDFTGNGLSVSGQVLGEHARDCRFLLPIVCPHDAPRTLSGSALTLVGEDACLCVEASAIAAGPQPIFWLAGGFEALELSILPDEAGRFSFSISAEEGRG